MSQLYPKTLLPRKEYKYIDCEVNENYLIRYVDRDSEDESIIDEFGRILVEHIGTPREKVQDLSVSLLGVYKKAYTKLKFTTDGADYGTYCQPNEDVASPIYSEHFDNDKLRSFWVIQINKIVGRRVKINLNNVVKEAICYIQHTPTKGNFWHFSVRWSVDGEPIFNLDKKLELKIAKKIGANARALFSHFAKVEVDDNNGLSQNCYCIA